jgi:PTH1 family peptidyl-tRNA hydrolase
LIVVCGLGNPGKSYLETRHNIGFRVIDLIAQQNSKKFKKGGGKYLLARMAEEILLVKPLTYMNRSGLALKEILHEYKLSSEDLLVVCDDCDLPFGRIRLRRDGGAGGHHGLESIIEQLGSNRFSRIRIGIGRPFEEALEDYVLSDFSTTEKKEIEGILKRAADAVLLFIEEGVDKAMSIVNNPDYSLENELKS